MVMEKKGCIDPKKGLQYECSPFRNIINEMYAKDTSRLMELLRYVLWILFIQCCCICLFMVKSNLNQLIFLFQKQSQLKYRVS